MNSLPKTVSRQRRDCDLNPVPSVPESSTLTTRGVVIMEHWRAGGHCSRRASAAWANAGSATLSAYVDSRTQICFVMFPPIH